MNTRLLRRVAKHILAEPKGFIMGRVMMKKNEEDPLVVETENVDGQSEWKFPRCGTAACISGHACLITKSTVGWDEGKKALKLTKQQADTLFGLWNWPKRFHQSFLCGKTPTARAKIAVARIEHFIKTKGAE